MKKPNWKRRGLARHLTALERRIARDRRAIERQVDRTDLPPELKDFARKNPGLIR